MSGFEIAGVILPILIETLKVYKSVHKGYRTFRNWSTEVEKIYRQFSIRRTSFRNECRLLLLLVEDDQRASAILETLEASQSWLSKEVDEKLTGVLKESADACRCLIESSKESLDVMQEELAHFDVFKQRKEQDEPIKAAIRRLRNAISITFDESKHQKSLATLRECNAELAQLRSQIGAFQQYAGCSTDGICVSRKPLPSRFGAIRATSKKLHEALSSAWCCGFPSHSGHSAKICLDAQVDAEVQLDLAISCHEDQERVLSEPPIWLYVQSICIDAVRCRLQPAQTDSTPLPASTFDFGRGSLKKKASSELIQRTTCKRSKKRVRIVVPEAEQENTSSHAVGNQTATAVAILHTVAQQTTPGIDLCQMKNICHYLKQNLQICGKPPTKHCIGYLETPQMYRHMFYLQEKSLGSQSQLKDVNQASIYSLSDLLRHDEDWSLDIVDQLKLAHKIALAILQFHETPWLTQNWRLHDLSYFGHTGQYEEAVLQTLHLSSQIAPARGIEPPTMEGVESATEVISEEEYFGIENPTLFSLGVALMELARWEPLESMSNQKDPNAILTARRVSRRSTPLGPKYQEIVRKCLQCNFGFGTDLNKEELQAAVYGDVVLPLEKMIETLSI
ncbi:hypothetical protein BCR34DRAFT_601219 [Clohesyomyces aquaticus]|uniref:DUF7580 domain-containing protein n=1 Tax=Clohesyomyces aquaticus TaxID=1231657 RepID=A0A1Y1ZN39_9PLEO|nr:hypothetical protein BCR34DRAFT_601219 [Clohesyomyces aquaticus]